MSAMATNSEAPNNLRRTDGEPFEFLAVATHKAYAVHPTELQPRAVDRNSAATYTHI